MSATTTSISEELRIRSEGRVEVVERALARLEREAKSFDLDEPPRAVPGLTADEGDAVAEVERLEPALPLLVAVRAAVQRAREAADQWATRHGLKDAATHLPVKSRKRTWFFGEPHISRFYWAAATGLATATVGTIGFGLGYVPFAFGAVVATGILPLIPLLYPRQREVLITPRALVLDRIELQFKEISAITTRKWTPNWAGLTITHDSRTIRVSVRRELAEQLVEAFNAFQKSVNQNTAPVSPVA